MLARRIDAPHCAIVTIAIAVNVFCDNDRHVAAFAFGCRSTSLDRRSAINISCDSVRHYPNVSGGTIICTHRCVRVKITLDSAVSIASQLSTATDENEKLMLLHDLERVYFYSNAKLRPRYHAHGSAAAEPAKQYLNAYRTID